MKINNLTLIVLILFFAIPAKGETDIILYFSNLDNIKQDGNIAENEYPVKYLLPNVDGDLFAELSMAHNITHLSVGLQVDVDGWIGFGMNKNSEKGMAGAEMIISSVTNNVLTIGKFHAIGNQKPEDDGDAYELVNNAAGTESGGKTIVEFIIPMKEDNDNRFNLEVDKEYSFFVAAHETSDTLQYHDMRTPVFSVTIGDETMTPDNVEIDLSLIKEDSGAQNQDLFIVVIFFGGIGLIIQKNRNVITN